MILCIALVVLYPMAMLLAFIEWLYSMIAAIVTGIIELPFAFRDAHHTWRRHWFEARSPGSLRREHLDRVFPTDPPKDTP